MQPVRVLVMLCTFAALGPVSAQQPATQQAPPAPVPQQFAYPSKGQSPEQQKQDAYECHMWAVQQTGFDPTASPPQLAAPNPAPQNHPLPAIGLRGQMRQALVGEMMAEEQKMAGKSQAQKQAAQQAAAHSQALANYQRARAACLEGRGYNVR